MVIDLESDNSDDKDNLTTVLIWSLITLMIKITYDYFSLITLMMKMFSRCVKVRTSARKLSLPAVLNFY